jgi:PII-like signaling protein
LAIVECARAEGLAGATVTRGIVGFGANSRIHPSGFLRISEDLPVVITIVDTAEKIEAFMPRVHEMVGEGMVMTWDVDVQLYRHARS